MEPLRARRANVANQRADDLVRRVGRELRIARVALGVSQQALAELVGGSQSTIYEIERGGLAPDVATLSRLANAVGMNLGVRFHPNGAVHLRDSGQLAIAQGLVTQAHPIWTPALEQPVAAPPDLRAADLVLVQPAEGA
jgi:transcriptional regulator with XRE-family HTH domain